jgi:hypothetical protein
MDARMTINWEELSAEDVAAIRVAVLAMALTVRVPDAGSVQGWIAFQRRIVRIAEKLEFEGNHPPS